MQGWPGLVSFLKRHGIERSVFDAALAEGKLWCCACRSFLPGDDFHVSLHAYQRQRQTRCKKCSEEYRLSYQVNWYEKNKDVRREKQREYYKKNRGVIRKRARDWRLALPPEERKRLARAGALKRKYGITLQQYKSMLVEQGGGCAICARPPITGKPLCVDHNHTTMQVRGLLCQTCNHFVGYFETHHERVAPLISYLEKYRL